MCYNNWILSGQRRCENTVKKIEIEIGLRNQGNVEVKTGLQSGDTIVAEGLRKTRPNGKIKPIKFGSKEVTSNWKKKAQPNKTEAKKGKFDWIKKLNIFKKSESKKEDNKSK